MSQSQNYFKKIKKLLKITDNTVYSDALMLIGGEKLQ